MPTNFIETIKGRPDAPVVVVSGLFGGILAASVQALFKSDGNLTTFFVPYLTIGQYAWFGLFGMLAAGFSVYVAANCQRDDLIRLAFFALSCGIAFPAILLETQTKVAKQTQAKIENVSDLVANQPANQIAQVAPAAAATVTKTLAQTPASEVDDQTKAIVSDQTTGIIQDLNSANTPAASAAAKQIFSAAKRAGYNVQAPTIQVPPAVQGPPPPAPSGQ